MDAHDTSIAPLLRKILLRFGLGIGIIAAVFFVSAGTLSYWQAWVYLVVMAVPMGIVVIVFLKRDPEVIERRLHAGEKDKEQSLIVKLGSLSYLLVFLVPGLDRRYGWSDVPAAAVIAADVVYLLGYALFVRVLLENAYASRVVEVAEGQKVISTGPYALIRHPMYTAALTMFLATPIALGSWWAFLPALTLIAVFVARIFSEERILAAQLPGYKEYLASHRYRLIPGVW